MISRLATFSHTRRPFSVSRPSRSDTILTKIKDFVFASEKENFHNDFVKRAHAWDKLSKSEWQLIYRDIGASRSFFLVSLAIPASFLGAAYMSWDYFSNPPWDRSDLVRRLEKDAKQLGFLIAIPLVAVIAVVITLLRVHHCRLLRIYQNRKNVDDFIAIRSQCVVKQQQMKFNRDSAAAFYYDEDREILKLFLNFVCGNIQIGRSKLFVLDECFLGNNYRSYMLNETSVPPRLTPSKM